MHLLGAWISVLTSVLFPFRYLPVSGPTPSFWTDSPEANPLAKHGSTGLLTTDADVCIIGSGITGVSAAYALSKANIEKPLKAVIFEARDFCSGATGRNGGHLTPNPFFAFSAHSQEHGTQEALRSIALESHTTKSLLHFITDSSLGDAVDLVQSRRAVLVSDEEQRQMLQRDFNMARMHGVDMGDVNWVDAETMMASYGTRYPAIMHPGNNLWPLKLVNRLYHAAASMSGLNFSLSLHTHTPVLAISPTQTLVSSSSQKRARRQILHTPRGAVTCTSVLHASNAYTPHLLPHLHEIMPVRGQVIALRLHSGYAGSGVAWSAHAGYEYWFTRPGGEGTTYEPIVVLGGARNASLSDPPDETWNVNDAEVNEEIGQALRHFLGKIFLRERIKATVEWEWTGIMGFTPSKDPMVGPVLLPGPDDKPSSEHCGEYLAAGYSGYGMTRASGCAEALVDIMLSEMRNMEIAKEQSWGERWESQKSAIESTMPEWFPRRYLTWNRIG